MGDTAVTHNDTASRFELTLDGKTAILTYKLKPGQIVFTHTEVPKELEGGGVGGKLARAGLEFARERGLQAVPLCPFIAAYIKRHQEYLDLVPFEHRDRILAKST
jgi:predicted GNAT family acetyltransferase